MYGLFKEYTKEAKKTIRYIFRKYGPLELNNDLELVMDGTKILAMEVSDNV